MSKKTLLNEATVRQFMKYANIGSLAQGFINETYKMLTDAGIAVTSPKPIGSSLQSFLHDPAGNRIEIHQCE